MADYFKIKKDGDPIYELYLIESGKKAKDGVKYLSSFDDFEEKEGGIRIYKRTGRNKDSIKGDYDLMIESIGVTDLSSMRFSKESTFKSFTIFQIESVKLSHKYEDRSNTDFSTCLKNPRLITSTDILKVKTGSSWPDCSIKDAEGFEALIAGIRREISLGKLGI
jgi:hypothetical protein